MFATLISDRKSLRFASLVGIILSFVLLVVMNASCGVLALHVSVGATPSMKAKNNDKKWLANSPLFSYRHGRFMREKDSVLFDWSGFIISTQLTFSQNRTSTGNTLNAIIHFISHNNQYNANLWRLNDKLEKVKLLQEQILATNKSSENFELNFSWPLEEDAQSYAVEVELEKRTEPHIGLVQFFGMTFLQQVSPIVTREKLNNDGLKIEFIGDSITCGYGNLGKPPCPYKTSTQNIHDSFVEKTARKLNASDIHVQCWSGKGMVRNHGDKNTTSAEPFISYYPRTLATDPATSWDFQKTFVPDIVVITLGTNDFSTAPRPSFEEFYAGYQRFIDFVFSKYGPVKGPSFKIVMVSIVTTANYGDFIQKTAERQPGYGKNVFFANLRDVLRNFLPSDWGCGIHPNIYGDEKMAVALSSYISQNVL